MWVKAATAGTILPHALPGGRQNAALRYNKNYGVLPHALPGEGKTEQVIVRAAVKFYRTLCLDLSDLTSLDTKLLREEVD